MVTLWKLSNRNCCVRERAVQRRNYWRCMMSRKMVFNVVAHDQDDYTKNTFGSMSNVLPYSILYEHKLFTHNFRIPFLIRMVTVKAFAVPAKVPRRSQFCRTIGQPLILPQTHQYPDTSAETLGCDLLASFLRFTATYNSCRELFSRPTHPIRHKGETSFLMRFLFPMPPVLL